MLVSFDSFLTGLYLGFLENPWAFSRPPWKIVRLHVSHWERSGSVVECLTRDRGAAGSSLTCVTMFWSLSKTHLSQLSTGLTQEDRPCLTERSLMGCKESNQTNNTYLTVYSLWQITRDQP